MPHLLLKTALIFTLVLTAIGLAARTFGSTQPPNPALRGFTEGCEDKPQPCWYSIVVGETVIEDAIRILNQKGYSTTLNNNTSESIKQVWDVKSSDENQCLITLVTSPVWTDATQTKMVRLIETFILQACPHIKLGDLFVVFKTPQITYTPTSCKANGITFEYMSLNDWRINQSSNSATSPFVRQDSIDTISINWYGDLYVNFDDSWHGFAFPWKLSRTLWDKYCSYG